MKEEVIADNWSDLSREELARCRIANEEEFLEWYGALDRIDDIDEGAVRELAREGRVGYLELGSIREKLEYAYDKMVEHKLIPNERYAVGYIRLNAKPASLRFTDTKSYRETINRVIVDGENASQEIALRRFCRENRYVKFVSLMEIQSSEVVEQESLHLLKLAISLCEIKNALFTYCELGPTFKHPEFYSVVRAAKQRGVKVEAIKNVAAYQDARLHVRKRKVFTKKNTGKQKAERAKLAKIERYPILVWKKARQIPTKRFNSYEFLFNGTDPIFRYFLTNRTKFEEDPSVWKPVNDFDKNIADALHDEGHLTVEGYGWNKQLARKARIMIASKEFKEYCVEKFRLMAIWELKDANHRDGLILP